MGVPEYCGRIESGDLRQETGSEKCADRRQLFFGAGDSAQQDKREGKQSVRLQEVHSHSTQQVEIIQSGAIR